MAEEEKPQAIRMYLGMPARTMSNKPEQYRLARKKDGTIVLQGGFMWSEGLATGIEWREIPMVDFETGQPIFS